MLVAMERWHWTVAGALGQMSIAITRRRVRHEALAEWAVALVKVAEEMRAQAPLALTSKKRVLSRRGRRV